MNVSNNDKCKLLLGNLYGDGNYQRNPKYENATYILSKHSSKQNEYVYYLERLYKWLGIYQFSKYNCPNCGGFSPNGFNSYVAAKPPIINYFESPDFYDSNRKKIITENGLWKLSTFGLMLWFLDDGSLSVFKNNKGTKRHARISTQSYNYNEHEIIKKVFFDRWKIKTKIYGQTHQFTKKYYNYICMEATQFRKFFDLVRPYLKSIPNSMKYKFNMDYTVRQFYKYNLY